MMVDFIGISFLLLFWFASDSVAFYKDKFFEYDLLIKWKAIRFAAGLVVSLPLAVYLIHRINVVYFT